MMNISFPETPSPEECANTIFEISGTKFDPEIATDIWAKILQHKWLMSEKLGRDVGLRTACIDFLENMDQALKEYTDYEKQDVLSEMGAQIISREIWDTISDSQPPKQMVQFTPADIEYLFQQVAQFAFEQEYASKQDYRVTTNTFNQILPKLRPSLTDEIIQEFQKDSITYSRT